MGVCYRPPWLDVSGIEPVTATHDHPNPVRGSEGDRPAQSSQLDVSGIEPVTATHDHPNPVRGSEGDRPPQSSQLDVSGIEPVTATHDHPNPVRGSEGDRLRDRLRLQLLDDTEILITAIRGEAHKDNRCRQNDDSQPLAAIGYAVEGEPTN